MFGPEGGLVANGGCAIHPCDPSIYPIHISRNTTAPHIPVHLGAMQDAVRFQIRFWADHGGLADGDVLVSNHPQLAGGSHLPDITVITPVFSQPSDGGESAVVFFVASRGHHADIGGIAPGSMPPLSKTLAEEGAAIVAFKLVEDGVFDEAGITELLTAPGEMVWVASRVVVQIKLRAT